MSFYSNLLQHPRRLLLRRAIFQVHLWLGILLSVYVALIGLSGSILVFEDDLRSIATQDLHAYPAHLAAPQIVLSNAQQAFPVDKPTFLQWPSTTTPAYTVYLVTSGSGTRILLADASDGHLLTDRPHLFIDTVHDFHVYLLMGQTGFVLNCVAGIGLLALALTGAVLWWPGLRLWQRSFRINLRACLKRINYDTHNLVGVLTLAIVSWWGLTAVYFLWPIQTAAAVSFISPLRGMKEPELSKTASSSPTASSPVKVGFGLPLTIILTQIYTLNPHGFLSGISLPADLTSPAGNVVAYIDTSTPGDFSHRDIHTFSAATGQLLTTWHYGQNHTIGDWVLWLVYPLHFGTLWGLPVQILWCLLGLSLPILSFTGLLMYWNRYLRNRWKALRSDFS